MAQNTKTDSVEKWGIHETILQGPADGNPFVDTALSAEYTHGHRTVVVDGFYDGDGAYRLRFMPDSEGEWTFRTTSNRAALDGRTGRFECTAASVDNHGPVRVRNTTHFAYEDGTPYSCVGTTCYAWVHQGDALAEQTLETLRAAPFNKMRMCVFPKSYRYCENEPLYHAFEDGPAKDSDQSRFNPAFFRNVEKRVMQLRDIGVEADIILFHPYDYGRWGYDRMSAGTDDRYLRYVIARLAAYRNVWWSMANEWDLMKEKADSDWDRYFRIVSESDPYRHLRSVHNANRWYDHTRAWVTHVSIQGTCFDRIPRLLGEYRKPLVFDECCYEGNVSPIWGNITAREMVHRFWEGFARGGAVGHGETYLHPRDILWWSKGGELHGESPERIAFLRKIIEDAPLTELQPLDLGWDTVPACGKTPDYYLHYFGVMQPAERDIRLPEEHRYTVEVIDTWAMTVERLDGEFSGACRIPLPGKPGLALRIRRIAA